VLTPRDFLQLGTRAAVDQALSRLVKRGELRRLTRGVYQRPQVHPKLGLLAPSSEAVAHAVTQSQATRLLPSGAYAANLLRLSEQVPAQAVYLTDGPSRTLRFGNQEVTLKHASPRRMQFASQGTGLVREALRYLGPDHVTPERLQSLQATLRPETRSALLQDLPYAPAWMHPYLRALAEEGA
jgi:hypothetical protein